MATHTAHECPLPLPHRPRRQCYRAMARGFVPPSSSHVVERVQEEAYACFFYGERAALAKRRACPRAMVEAGQTAVATMLSIFHGTIDR